MKTCAKCLQQKPFDDFTLRRGKPNARCRICTREASKKHYYENRAYYLEKARKRSQVIFEANRQYVWRYLLAHPCVDCGESDPVVLEFDHVRGTKTRAIAELVRSAFSEKYILKEIKKCDVRCANCHRRRTAKQLGWYKNLGL